MSLYFALLGAMTATLSAMFPLLLRLFRRIQEKHDTARQTYRGRLVAKLEAGHRLNSKEILDIARGASVSSSSAIDAVYELYSSETDPERCAQLRQILDDFQRTEPFEGFPAEVKPSMAILSRLCSDSQDEGVRNALGPIHKTIEKYQELQKDYERSRSLTRNSFVVAAISFLVGVAGLVLAFRSPSTSDIQRIVSESVRQSIEKNLQPDAPADRGQPGASHLSAPGS